MGLADHMMEHLRVFEKILIEESIFFPFSSDTVTIIVEFVLAFLTAGSVFRKRVREGRIPVAN